MISKCYDKCYDFTKLSVISFQKHSVALFYIKYISMTMMMMMMMKMMNSFCGVKPYFQLGPLSEVATIANLQHATSKHATSRIWTCVEPELKLCWRKLCSSDNHYTKAPHNTFWEEKYIEPQTFVDADYLLNYIGIKLLLPL